MKITRNNKDDRGTNNSMAAIDREIRLFHCMAFL